MPRSTCARRATKAKAFPLDPNNGILHFAVDAGSNQVNPTRSALLLAVAGREDGKLEVGEIDSLQLNAERVVPESMEGRSDETTAFEFDSRQH